MKNLLPVFVLIILVWGCAKKITPSNSGSQASNSPTMPAESNTGKVTAPAAETAAPAANATSETKVEPKETEVETIAIAAGQTIYKAKCGGCHALKVTTAFTAERWVSILAVMAPNARLSAIEKENVYAYVKANAKK